MSFLHVYVHTVDTRGTASSCDFRYAFVSVSDVQVFPVGGHENNLINKGCVAQRAKVLPTIICWHRSSATPPTHRRHCTVGVMQSCSCLHARIQQSSPPAKARLGQGPGSLVAIVLRFCCAFIYPTAICLSSSSCTLSSFHAAHFATYLTQLPPYPADDSSRRNVTPPPSLN